MTPDQLFDLWLDVIEDLGVNPEDEFDIEELVAPAFSEATGLEHLGSGSSRSVFLLDPERVIKLSIDLGNESNLFECSTWLKYRDSPAQAKWLAPVLECADDGSWLIMQRAQPAPDEAVRDVIFGEERYDLYLIGAEDWQHPMQWGTIDGQLKLVDYGWGFGSEGDLAALKDRLMPPA